MKKVSLQLLILIVFILSGFFVCSNSVQAITATTTNPYYSGYNFKDVWGTFVTDERFWFDGEYFRYSFTPTRDFYSQWYNYGDRISKSHFYSVWISTNYIFERGGGGGSGAYFLESLSDLDGYKKGDSIFFLWEKDHHYDTYIIEGTIPSSGVTEANTFLNWHFKDYPDDVLRPEYSFIKFGIRYVDYINHSHSRNYIDYDYAPEPDKLDPVILIPGILGSWNFGDGWELDPIFNTYDDLWSALKSAGYEEGVNLFAFPYNWRLPNVYSAMELKTKIDEVKAICDCDKVDLVAHSMGGLVARAYVEMGNYDNDIDQLIFLATPHRGSVASYLTWEGGELGIDKYDLLKNRIFKVESELNGYGSVYDYISLLPMTSIKELLPVYNYLKDQDSSGNWQLRDYGDNYPRNLFLELLNEPSQLAKLDSIGITNVIADTGENKTINYLKVISKDFIYGEWSDGYPDGYYNIFGDHGLEYGVGDGTVPYYSNSNFYNFNDTIVNSSHEAIVTDAQKVVIKELTGTEPTAEVRKNIFSKYLMIRIFSPADFVVVAPNGQRIGKDFDSQTTINEIAGAFYTGFDTDLEFVLIPDPLAGDYKVELQGTGSGDYKLSTSLISDDLAIDSDYEGIISLGEIDSYQVSLDGNSISDLNPDIDNLDQLIVEIEEMYNKGWLSHFGSKTALLSQLKNGWKNNKQFEQLNKFLDNLLSKERLNQRAYDIIKQALLNINHNL